MDSPDEISIKYNHFVSLNQNVLRLGNEVRELTDQLMKAKRQCESLREAGDEIWYCYRHRENLTEAIQEWVEVRDGNLK